MPITYDAIGNPLTYKRYTLTWQNGRQLASMRFGTVNIGFTYSMGIASAIFLGFQVVWDYDEYGGSTKDYFLAVGIDVGCSLAAVGVMSLLPAATPVAVVAIAAVGVGYASARLSGEIKKKYIN